MSLFELNCRHGDITKHKNGRYRHFESIIMESSPSSSYFNVFITGQIESVSFPLGPDAPEVFCRYEIITGPDWELVSGLKSGITQTAANNYGSYNDEIVFNMPIEITYQSTNPHGWPQLLICVYGRTRWGSETSLGYSRLHVPVFGSQTRQRLSAPIIVPKCQHMLSDIASWISGRNPELKDPKVLIDNSKCNDLSAEVYGEINLRLNIIARGINRLAYDWND